MSLADLYARQEQLLAQMTVLKAELAEINNSIYTLNKDRIEPLYERAGKQHGTVRLLADDDLEISGEIKKEVKWNTDLLREAAQEMTWKEAANIFKITFEVPEKNYGKLDPASNTKKKIDAARTVKYGELKISLHKQSGESK